MCDHGETGTTGTAGDTKTETKCATESMGRYLIPGTMRMIDLPMILMGRLIHRRCVGPATSHPRIEHE